MVILAKALPPQENRVNHAQPVNDYGQQKPLSVRKPSHGHRLARAAVSASRNCWAWGALLVSNPRPARASLSAPESVDGVHNLQAQTGPWLGRRMHGPRARQGKKARYTRGTPRDIPEVHRRQARSTPDHPRSFALCSRPVHAFIEPPPATPRASPKLPRFKVQSSGFEVQGSAPGTGHPPLSILDLTVPLLPAPTPHHPSGSAILQSSNPPTH